MSQFAVYRVKDQTKAPWQLSYFEVLEQKILSGNKITNRSILSMPKSGRMRWRSGNI